MGSLKSRSASELPDEMMSFMLAQFESNSLGPRLGRLLRHGRTPLQTPLYVATTSRGVVPHISQDVLQRHTSISAAYIALEDCKLLTVFTCSLR
jgi:queuine tRNA-ribosyltransferase accessory subunit